jgi:putative transposase
MPYNPNIHHRKSIRLKGYDYSMTGFYFITICVDRRGNPGWMPFGDVLNDEMILNDSGKMVEHEWLKLPQRFTSIKLHEFVVMPNHFHSIMEIIGATLVVAQNETGLQPSSWQPPSSGQPQGIAPTGKPKTVGDMVGAFQSMVTVEYIRGVKNLGWEPFNGKLWQRNYWEHIIRDKQSYHRIAEYIINNPKNWDNDKLNKK